MIDTFAVCQGSHSVQYIFGQAKETKTIGNRPCY